MSTVASNNYLSKEYLEEHYIHRGETRYKISEETGVDPAKIGSLLQKYGIKRYTVNRYGLCLHPLNIMWSGMKERCKNRNAENYKWYGGDGITVCDEWNEFANFYNWAIRNGWEDGLSIDRIDGTKGYSPENCRFITHKEQCRNRRSNVHITVDGETHLQCEWEEILGLRRKIISKWKYRYGEKYVVDKIKELRNKEALDGSGK